MARKPTRSGMEQTSPADRAGTADAPDNAAWTGSWRGWLVLVGGWLLPQLILIGPALVGRTVLVPVDLLALGGFYLPRTAEYQNVVPRDHVLSDLVLVGPAAREFCNREFRAGRLPLWQGDNYAGAPFATWPKYSLFELPYYLLPRPITLAWMQLAQVFFCGAGMWLFLRRTMNLSFWPAAIGGWCAPLGGFFSLWQGFPVVGPICWLPWLLFLVAGSVGRPWSVFSLGLAIATALVLYCGQSDVCGLVLLTTGLYSLWMLAVAQWDHPHWRQTSSAAGALAFAWILGFLLAAPYLLPLVEHTSTGSRMQARAAGLEERPPQGLQALPAVVLPEIYGSTRAGSQRLVEGILLESSSAAYVGLLATLWLAPLAWCDRLRRREVVFWTALAMVSLGWVLDFPGIVSLERTAPFNLLSYNRWTFATAAAVIVLAAVGLERVFAAPVPFRWWFTLPMLMTLGLGTWCLLAAVSLPQALRVKIRPENLAAVQANLAWYHLCGAVLALLVLGAWWATLAGIGRKPWARLAVAAALVAELSWFALRQDRQSSPELYFPRIAALEALATRPPGRIWGIGCLPPNLNQSHGLRDIRGYDAVDSADFVRLLEPARDPAYQSTLYATTQFAFPKIEMDTGRPRLSPIANLLNVRYLVQRYPPESNQPVVVERDDYWILENPAALPRATVPRSVRRVADREEALRIMGRADFDPAAVALVTDELEVPQKIEGTVTAQIETPTRIELKAAMATDGLVLIADLWDPGWQAEIDGRPCPISQVDYALRGVRVPRGDHVLVMTYRPASVRRGFQIAALAGVVALAWSAWLVVRTLGRRRPSKSLA